MQTETQLSKQIHLTRRSPSYWRVTIDHPPLNIFGPDTIPQLDEVITAIETDEDVKVVVFDSAVEGFFLTHYDFVAPVEDTTDEDDEDDDLRTKSSLSLAMALIRHESRVSCDEFTDG